MMVLFLGANATAGEGNKFQHKQVYVDVECISVELIVKGILFSSEYIHNVISIESLSLNLTHILAVENMEIWGTPHFKSNSSTMTAACMFYKIHSVG